MWSTTSGAHSDERRKQHIMNLTINPYLTTSIAADRRRAFSLEAQTSRTRKIGRLARRAARSAVFAEVHRAAAPADVTATDPATGPATAAVIAPTFGDRTKVLASSDLEHASARVA